MASFFFSFLCFFLSVLEVKHAIRFPSAPQCLITERKLRVWIFPFFLQNKSRDNISLNSLCLLLALIKRICNTQNRKYATDRNVRVGAEFFLRVSSFLPHGKSGMGFNMKLLRNGYIPVPWTMLANMIVIVYVAVLDITCCAAMLKFRNSGKDEERSIQLRKVMT